MIGGVGALLNNALGDMKEIVTKCIEISGNIWAGNEMKIKGNEMKWKYGRDVLIWFKTLRYKLIMWI